MRRRSAVKAILGFVVLAFLIPPRVEGGSGTEPHEHFERMQAAKRAQAHPVDFFAPFFSIEGLRETRLFLLNTIADPIVVDVVARSENRELPLGAYTIEAQRHIEISLRERLIGFEDAFGTGHLRLSVLGDSDTLQGWAVIVEPDGQAFELPLLAPEEGSSRKLYGFWDAAPLGASGPTPVTFHFLNTSAGELSLHLTSGGTGRIDSVAFLLSPGESILVAGLGEAPFGHSGWIKVEHDGEPGDLVGLGVLRRRTLIGSVPLIPRGEAEASRRHESLPTPPLGTEPEPSAESTQGWLTLLNVGPERQEVRVEALDAASGAGLAHLSLEISPWKVTTLPLARLLPSGVSTRNARLRVQGSAPGLLVRGSEMVRPDLAADIPFFSAYHAHGNGTYPLPDLERYESVTPIVNLGEEPAEIVAQVYWDGGTFAYGPIILPAGAGHVIDLEDLAKTAGPDLLGRTLDSNRPPAVLKWTVTSGSTKLLGRTLVRPRGSEDRFGFNCFGCCLQKPKGEVVPRAVDFFVGQLVSFEVAVKYTTCSGEMGPYSTNATSLTVPSPFTWDSHLVGASGPALETLSFTGSGTFVSSDCQEFEIEFTGSGTSSSCNTHLKRPDSPGQSWNPGATCSSQTSSCSLCQACCQQIYAWQLCRKVDPRVATLNRNNCLGICLSDRC